MKKLRGMVTVIVIIALIPLLIISLLVIDVARVSYSRNLIEDANELVLQAQLSNYNTVLKDTYGLFAAKNVDPNSTEFKTKLAKILVDATNGQLDSSQSQQIANDIVSGKIPTYTGKASSMNIMPQSFSIEAAKDGTLKNPNILKNQILKYMEYRGLVSIGYGLFEKIKGFKAVNFERDVIDKKLSYEMQRDDMISKLEKYYKNLKSIADSQETFNGYLTKENDELKVVEDAKETVYNLLIGSKDTKELQGFISHYEDVVKWKTFNKLKKSDTKHTKEELQKRVVQFFKGELNKECSLVEKDKNLINEKLRLKHDDYTEVSAFIETLTESSKCAKVRNLYQDIAAHNNEEFKSEDEKLSISSNDVNRINSFIDHFYNKILENYRNQLNEKLKVMYDKLINRREFYRQYRDNITKAEEILNDTETLLDQLEEKRKAWEKANNTEELKGSEFQDRTEKEIVVLSAGLKKEDVRTLKKIISAEKENLDKKIEFINQFHIHYKGKSTNLLTHYPVKVDGEGNANATQYMEAVINLFKNETHENPITAFALYDNHRSSRPSYDKNDKLVKDNEFYQYIVRIATKFSNKKGDTDAKAKELKDLYNQASTMRTHDEQKVGGRATGDFKFSKNASKSNDEKVRNMEEANSGIISTAIDTLKDLGSFVLNISEITNLKEWIHEALLMEYSTEMFTDYLDSHEGSCKLTRPTLLSGKQVSSMYANEKMKNNLGSEAEFILNGHSKGKDNVEATKNRILLLRFGFNLVYSFMDAEINAMTTQASIVAGPFAPLLKTILHVVVAFLESGIDIYRMADLCQSIPIYKTPRTWVLKPSITEGQIDLAKGFTKEKVTSSIESVFEVINDRTIETMDVLKKNADLVAKDFITQKKESIQNMIQSELQTPLTEIVSSVVSSANLSNVEELVKQKFDDLAATIEKSEFSTILQPLFDTARDSFESQIIEEVKNAKDDPSQVAGKLSSSIITGFNDIVESSESMITDFVNKQYGKLQEEVTKALESAQEKTVEAAKKQVEKIFSKYTTDAPKSLGTPEKGKGEGLNLNYREYLKIFMLLKIKSSEEEVLQRIAALIEHNMKSLGDSNFKFEDYASVFKIKTDYKVNTVLIGSDSQGKIEEFDNIKDLKFWKMFQNSIESVVGY